MIAQLERCNRHFKEKRYRITDNFTVMAYCEDCEAEMVKLVQLLLEPENKSKSCGFCETPCGNEWCCMNEKKDES